MIRLLQSSIKVDSCTRRIVLGQSSRSTNFFEDDTYISNILSSEFSAIISFFHPLDFVNVSKFVRMNRHGRSYEDNKEIFVLKFPGAIFRLSFRCILFFC